MTARRALQELTEQGVLYRTQGVGRFVASPKSQSSLLEIRNIADEIQRRGHFHKAELVQLTSLPCPGVVATALRFKSQCASVFFHSLCITKINSRCSWKPVMSIRSKCRTYLASGLCFANTA